jgi:hypothetical protein
VYRSAEAAVVLLDIVAFSTGFDLGVMARTREPVAVQPATNFLEQHLRFGIEFAEGRRVVQFRGVPQANLPKAGETMPSGPILLQRGGGGRGPERLDLYFWVWPLPPPGTLTIGFEWPGPVPFTTAELDAVAILEAAARSDVLWPSQALQPRASGNTKSALVPEKLTHAASAGPMP